MLNVKTEVPKYITPHVREFCHMVVPNQEPLYIDVQPVAEGRYGECFHNVKMVVASMGGTIQYGWLIWEYPSVMIEAEFHAVWVSTDNKLIDVTPTPFSTNLLFLPDPSRKYIGKQVDSIRKALSDEPMIKEFVEINNILLNDKTSNSIPYDIKQHIKKRYMHIKNYIDKPPRNPNRNDQCSCGSGMKYKKCCGK